MRVNPVVTLSSRQGRRRYAHSRLFSKIVVSTAVLFFAGVGGLMRGAYLSAVYAQSSSALRGTVRAFNQDGKAWPAIASNDPQAPQFVDKVSYGLENGIIEFWLDNPSFGTKVNGGVVITAENGKRFVLPRGTTGSIGGRTYTTRVELSSKGGETNVSSVFFFYEPDGLVSSMATVRPATLMQNLQISYRYTPDEELTSYAIMNPSETKEISLVETIFDQNNKKFAQLTFNHIPPLGSVTDYVHRAVENVPERGYVTFTSSDPLAGIGFIVRPKEGKITVREPEENDKPISVPLIKVVGLLDDGDVNDPKLMSPLTTGKLTCAGKDLPINEFGYGDFTNGGSDIKTFDDGKMDCTLDVPGYVREEMEVLSPSRILPAVKQDLYNIAFASKIWIVGGAGANLPPTNYMFDFTKPVEFYWITQGVDLTNSGEFAARNAFRHRVWYQFPKLGIIAGGSPLGGKAHYHETDTIPSDLTNTYVVMKDPMRTTGGIGIMFEQDKSKFIVKNATVHSRQGLHVPLGLASEDGIGFGLEDNDFSDLASVGMSLVDTSINDANQGHLFFTPLDINQIRVKYFKPLGTQILQGPSGLYFKHPPLQ